ncbi:hypothetical protein KR059_004310 [Drosophila kikkawai]|nr:hypothetical protein KR059_004310 [Drosophila kikkawai]
MTWGETSFSDISYAQDGDLQFARQLQAQLNDSELDSSLQFIYSDGEQPDSVQHARPPQQKPKDSYKPEDVAPDYLNQTQNLVHPGWELVDPSPDIYSMFSRFNQKFFQDRLGAVVLEWSKRMFSCAGICYQRSNRYIKEVTIRLSEPLLKLRPRKDLVETLLHEMIHAYFFILNVREGNGGHGPNFKQKMNMINKVAGTNITVYHSFHDEVAAYRTHIWRCTGICQNHTPFMGWVKRTSNRAPGPSDQWWEKHQRDCGGTFMKVSEPTKAPKPPKAIKPPKTSKKAPPAVADPKTDIRGWFKKPPAKKPATNNAVRGAVPPSKPLQGGNNSTLPNPWPPQFKPKPAGANIKSFGDLSRDSEDDEPPAKTNREKFPSFKETEEGYAMPGAAHGEARSIREIRERRFGKQEKQTPPSEPSVNGNKKSEQWESYDEDVMVRDAPEIMINLIDDSSSSDDEPAAHKDIRFPMSSQERSENVKREVLEDESISFVKDDIVFIDDEYNDEEREEGNDPAINPIGMDGHASLLLEFRNHNDVVPSCSSHVNNEETDIVCCPICFDSIRRIDLSNHLDGCSITQRVAPPSFKRAGGGGVTKTESSVRGRKSKSESTKNTLRSCGYTESEVAALNLSSSSDDSTSMLASEDELTPRQRRQRGLFKSTVGCPKCGQEFMGHQLEAHRQICPGKKRRH